MLLALSSCMAAITPPMGPRPDCPPSALVIGKLCIAADRACANGDLVLLAGIATQLAALVAPPLDTYLTELAGLCDGDPARAVAAWTRLKEYVYQDSQRGAR